MNNNEHLYNKSMKETNTFDATPVLDKEYIWTGNIRVKVVAVEITKIDAKIHSDGSISPERNDFRVTLQYSDPQYKYFGISITTRWTKYSFEPV